MQEIKQLWQHYVERVLAHDAAGASACWVADESATAISSQVIRGADAVRAQYFQATFDMVPDDIWQPKHEQFCMVGPDAAYVTYSYDFSGTIGGTFYEREGLGSNLFVRTPGGWRIQHEHCHLLPPKKK